MITPQYIQTGDMVGIVAPAGRVPEVPVRAFADMLDQEGFHIALGNHLFDSHYRYASTDIRRSGDLEYMLQDPAIKAVIAARGGYGSLRTLQHLTEKVWKENPKWLVGFSDITVLHMALQKYGMESIHGLMAVQYEETGDYKASFSNLVKALKGQLVQYEVPSQPMNRPGWGEGVLTGGNLSVLMSLRGTPWFPELDNKILFLEEVGEELYHIDRMMQGLYASGALEGLQGLIVGGFTSMKDDPRDPFGADYQDIILQVVKHYDYPVCFGFPAGHQLPNSVLFFGRKLQMLVTGAITEIKF